MHDLHIHLGGAVPSSVLWEILCDNGLRTEFVDFTSFHDSLTARPDQVKSLDDFLGRYFQVTEEIQSSPSAASVSAYQVVAKAYRRAQVTALELRFNPQKRRRHGLHTMDAIILAVMQGLEGFDLDRREAPLGDEADVLRCHPAGYLARVKAAVPGQGWAQLDGDTYLSPGSFTAAMRAISTMSRVPAAFCRNRAVSPAPTPPSSRKIITTSKFMAGAPHCRSTSTTAGR